MSTRETLPSHHTRIQPPRLKLLIESSTLWGPHKWAHHSNSFNSWNTAAPRHQLMHFMKLKMRKVKVPVDGFSPALDGSSRSVIDNLRINKSRADKNRAPNAVEVQREQYREKCVCRWFNIHIVIPLVDTANLNSINIVKCENSCAGKLCENLLHGTDTRCMLGFIFGSELIKFRSRKLGCCFASIQLMLQQLINLAILHAPQGATF